MYTIWDFYQTKNLHVILPINERFSVETLLTGWPVVVKDLIRKPHQISSLKSS